MAELVSIVIPVYNSARWVDCAIESALDQSWPNKEVIVLDDDSTDGSFNVLKKWNGKIRLERASSNRGTNPSRNTLATLSTGAWLVYLDADDELATDAVEAKMSYVERADAIYGTMEKHEYNGDDLVRIDRVDAVRNVDPIVTAFQWKYPNTSAFMFRRSAIVDVGGWNDRLQNCTDYDIYFRFLLAGKRLVGAPKSVSMYRFWSRTQMAAQNPLRMASSQLEVMWQTIEELERRNQLNELIREAFSNTALLAIRSMYPFDRSRALAEHKKLISWHPKLVLSSELFSDAFCASYQVFGLRGAEALGRAARRLRRLAHVSSFTSSRKER